MTDLEKELRAGIHEALDIIVWMSGSADFGEGGYAHERWLKVRPRLDALFALSAKASLPSPQRSDRE